MKVRFEVLNHSHSVQVITDTEVNAAVFMAACVLHANGGGYDPHINREEEDGKLTFRVVEKHGDGKWPLIESWMQLANYMFRGQFEVTEDFKREANRRYQARENKGEFDPPSYF